MDYYEALSWEWLVRKVSCLKCYTILSPMLLTYPNQLGKKKQTNSCPLYKTSIVTDILLNPLGWYLPFLQGWKSKWHPPYGVRGNPPM